MAAVIILTEMGENVNSSRTLSFRRWCSQATGNWFAGGFDGTGNQGYTVWNAIDKSFHLELC
jgi:hypothetical protein